MAKLLSSVIVLIAFQISEALFSHWSWQDCSDPSTAYVRFTTFDILPKPVVLPGVINVTIAGSLIHEINQDVTLNVTVKKNLLGRWTNIPCNKQLGSCDYDNPCEFLQVFETNGTCPVALATHGLPCTCPFHVSSNLNMPYSLFNVTSVRPEYQWLQNGDFKLDVKLYKKNPASMIGCFQATFGVTQKDCTGFFCGK